MKKAALFLICLISVSTFAQIPVIKRELSAIFFEFRLPMSKFELRKKLNTSENFYSFQESENGDHDILSFSFKDHYKLSFQRKKYTGRCDFWFVNGTDSLFAASMDLIFKANDTEIAENQFDEFIRFFKPISFKTEVKPRYVGKEKIGDVFLAFSSKKAYELGKPYLVIMNSYHLVEKRENVTQIPPPGEYYWISFSYYPNRLN